MNFELLPILTDYANWKKGGMKLKKNLLLWNYWDNFIIMLIHFKFGHFLLKIEQFWLFEEISIFSNGGHLGYRTALTDTILNGDHLRIISAKFGWNWLSSFRGEDFFLISSSLFSNLHN
jgi:hypothetical protein